MPSYNQKIHKDFISQPQILSNPRFFPTSLARPSGASQGSWVSVSAQKKKKKILTEESMNRLEILF